MNAAEQAALQEMANTRTLAVDAISNRAAQLAAALTEAQERIKSLTDQVEKQAEEIAKLKEGATPGKKK